MLGSSRARKCSQYLVSRARLAFFMRVLQVAQFVLHKRVAGNTTLLCETNCETCKTRMKNASLARETINCEHLYETRREAAWPSGWRNFEDFENGTVSVFNRIGIQATGVAKYDERLTNSHAFHVSSRKISETLMQIR
ncbi:hypothetical protein L5515_008915 [Caenorhabditis briggsae]|uniref:Uncharacterized protein n=1 Tax=Caenorhabditis briggsae TaxID=6238 RepID=A0AAE9F8P8_CAEBR|nr:hypothetical protein L5515_008915 [Caenorhabditis briggsae]